jgi:hypothetical protein
MADNGQRSPHHKPCITYSVMTDWPEGTPLVDVLEAVHSERRTGRLELQLNRGGVTHIRLVEFPSLDQEHKNLLTPDPLIG